MVKVTWS